MIVSRVGQEQSGANILRRDQDELPASLLRLVKPLLEKQRRSLAKQLDGLVAGRPRHAPRSEETSKKLHTSF